MRWQQAATPRWNNARIAGLPPMHAADCAREAMDLMYRYGGSTSFKRASRLAECWRDLHVVGQTATVGAGAVSDRRTRAAGDGCGTASAVVAEDFGTTD